MARGLNWLFFWSVELMRSSTKALTVSNLDQEHWQNGGHYGVWPLLLRILIGCSGSWRYTMGLQGKTEKDLDVHDFYRVLKLPTLFYVRKLREKRGKFQNFVKIVHIQVILLFSFLKMISLMFIKRTFISLSHKVPISNYRRSNILKCLASSNLAPLTKQSGRTSKHDKENLHFVCPLLCWLVVVRKVSDFVLSILIRTIYTVEVPNTYYYTVLLSWNSTGSIAKSRFWMWTWFLRNTIRTLNKLTKIYKETFSLSDCLVGNERERFYYWPIIEDCLYFAPENSYISSLLDVNFR